MELGSAGGCGCSDEEEREVAGYQVLGTRYWVLAKTKQMGTEVTDCGSVPFSVSPTDGDELGRRRCHRGGGGAADGLASVPG